MRPVQLDLEGFASFREPASVDFTGVEYFALVGPTGSGKSTVIDAMTFALYGSAPRWGRTNAIADALAPTTNRCVVRLVFDVGPARYAVAREVRRSGASISQKNTVLERLPDQNSIEADGEVLAGDPRGVTAEIERILGLSFEDFCKCIVLPQGQFQDFLRATARERQTILLKLLGADRYEEIGRQAGLRASIAGERERFLTAQLGDLADATEDAQIQARRREQDLAQLSAATDDALPAVLSAASGLEQAKSRHSDLSSERTLLAAVEIPEGVTRLQAQADETKATLRTTQLARHAAEEADTAARTALAMGPDRGRLEQVRELRRQFDELTVQEPDLAASEVATRTTEDEAGQAVGQAEALVTVRRQERDVARATQSAAQTALDRLDSERRELDSLDVPADVAELPDAVASATASLNGATKARIDAEASEEASRLALDSAPAREPLEEALRTLDAREAALSRLDEAMTACHRAEADDTALADAEQAAHEALSTARGAWSAAQTLSTAAFLRPQLAVGHRCPTCDQNVLTLPAPLDASELTIAEAAVAQAEAGWEAARTAHGVTMVALATRAAAVAEIRATVGLLSREPAVERDALRSELAELARLQVALTAHTRTAAAARDSERTAAEAARTVDLRIQTVRATLIAAHARLAPLGAPIIEEADVPGAWAALTAWTTARIRDLDEQFRPVTSNELAMATATSQNADRELAAVEASGHLARERQASAVQDRARAEAAHGQLLQRLGELERQLTGAPSAEVVATGLAQCKLLDDVVTRAGKDLIAARASHVTAEAEHASWGAVLVDARRVLQQTRDPLVALGAPAVDESDLATAWDHLLEWASAAVAAHDATLGDADRVIADAAANLNARQDKLVTLLEDHDVAVPEDTAANVLPVLVASALATARTRAELISARRQQAASMQRELSAAQEQRQVASLLAELLRSNRFPRWLASAALDALVEEASVVLNELTAGQFDLSHDKGDFVVIDHADADTFRSVRTLSGGETFQASLALALALAQQMARLGADSAARLDSIFLDEGFGTLDPDTLDVVAGTLENLAQGERMVGVITHVAALAERAPTRFAVRRNNRTSTIERVGP